MRREKELWLRLNPEPHAENQRQQYHERFTETVNRWLDAGHGRCILAQAECKAIMESSLTHFDGVRYELGEFVVMPNHVHAKGKESKSLALQSSQRAKRGRFAYCEPERLDNS